MIEMVASKLMEFSVQLKFFHWQTRSAFQHIAIGEAYDSVQPLIDEMVEMIMGKYGIFQFNGMQVTNMTAQYTDEDILLYQTFIENAIQYLQSLNTIFNNTDSDILNKRDEIMGVFSVLQFKSSFRE
ncbi:hypothetical protein [Microcystis phage Mel-JY01]